MRNMMFSRGTYYQDPTNHNYTFIFQYFWKWHSDRDAYDGKGRHERRQVGPRYHAESKTDCNRPHLTDTAPEPLSGCTFTRPVPEVAPFGSINGTAGILSGAIKLGGTSYTASGRDGSVRTILLNCTPSADAGQDQTAEGGGGGGGGWTS